MCVAAEPGRSGRRSPYLYAVGIDLGTTHTAAAVWRDGRAEIVPLGSQSAAIPSAVFLRSDGAILTGYSLTGRAAAWLMQVSTMEVIASAPIGPAGDASRIAVDLSADGKTLMAAYTSRRARAGWIQLYRIEPG